MDKTIIDQPIETETPADDRGAYVSLDGGRFGAEVVIYLADGIIQYLYYHQRMDQFFDPDIGIVIELPLMRLTIEGINLKDLSHALASRTVNQIIERHKEIELLVDDEVFIQKIIIERLYRN